MPSPFPGMDPYAERTDVWLELHNRLMVYACDALQALLPSNYVARLELRIYTERESNPERGPLRVPDLEVVRQGSGSRAGVGVAIEERETVAGGFWITSTLVERREAGVAIRSRGRGELVTAVELLSPSNKQAGTGRDRYLAKQNEILAAGLNLVEIDLLRDGLHTVAADEQELAPYRPFAYVLCVHRSRRAGDFWVYPWKLRQTLPRVPIPLGPGDGELTLDLQTLFSHAYDNAAVPKLVDYAGEPEPPLSGEDSAWAHDLLRSLAR